MDWYLSVALVLIGVGGVALAAEFVVPTGGILVVAAVTAFAVAVGVILLYGDQDEAVAAVIGLGLAVPIVGGLMVSAWKRLALKSVLTTEVAAPPGPGSELAAYRGMTGKTVSPLRPAGVVQLAGRRVDALSEGPLIDAGVWVRCVGVRAGTVVVRVAEPTRPLDEMGVDGLI